MALARPFKRFVMTSSLALGLLTGTTAATSAFDLSAMTDAERAAFREEVKAYLFDHPELIMEAVEIYRANQEQAQGALEQQMLTQNADAIYNHPDDLVMGNPDGDIVLVEFLDYRCGYCKKAHPEVKKLLETDGNIKLVVKEYPILGEESLLASRFALATKEVAGMDAYRAMHDALIETRSGINEGTLKRMAKKLDLDGDAILAAMSDKNVDAALARGQEIGAAFQISGTPTFIMNDEILRGYVPYDAMVEIVAELRG